MSKGKFCEKDSDGKFCHGIVPCMKSYLSGSSEDQQECQKETSGFYGQKLDKACKIPKNLNFSGLFQKYTYRVLQTIQMKLILLCVWAEPAILGSTKTALKTKYEI